MNQTKHTPGPWKIAKPEQFDSLQELDRLIHTTDNRHIAEVFQYQSPAAHNGESSEANARLIAAAPELLEALRWTTQLAEELWELQDEESEAQRCKCCVVRAKEALAKAEKGGEE